MIIAIVMGARPEIIEMAPMIRVCEKGANGIISDECLAVRCGD